MTIIAALLFILVWVALLVIVQKFAPEPFRMWILLAVIVIGLLIVVLKLWPAAGNLRIG